ncbi:MAG: TonB-dependent receptor [Wenzhouxiangellaceae bacterium]|nr:TonB-dependent receptor [Wenzhouxiangellaceae bacterium]
MKKDLLSSMVSAALCLGALAAIGPVAAQSEPEIGAKEENAAADAGRADFDTIIVTGSASGTVTKFESSIAISNFGETDIRESAPLTITDLYAEVPGFYVETSGGESAANVFARGIPAPGQFRFTKLQIDGLPTIEESGIPFLPPESYIKLDETIQRVEAVRGGSSTIFASNAAGGIINHITKKGGDFNEGYVGFEYGDFGRQRFDGFVAGPLTDRLSASVGGFFRTDDGVRDPGFTANEGGQLRSNFTYQIEDGELNFSAHYVDDKNIFYLPIPLGLDDSNDFTSIPGFDANDDTLTSADVRRARIVLPDGVREKDLTDGINTESFSLGFSIDRDFGDWRLSNKSRYVDGDTIFNAIFSITAPEDANDFLARELIRAQNAFPGTEQLALRFLGHGPGSDSTFGLAGPDSPGNNGNGLIIQSGWWNVETSVENFQNDLQLTTDFQAGGFHTLTLGGYYSFANYKSEWNFNNILQEVDGSPRGVDVFAVDGEGQVIGALTQNSFSRFGDFYRNYDADVRTLAVYATNEWEITDRLRLDFGARYEELRIEGDAERLGTFDLSDTNPLIGPDGLPTLADDAVTFGTGQFDPFKETYDEFAWAVGLNYIFTDSIAVYARANDAFRTPDPNDLAANPAGAGDLPVNDIFQAELGLKFNSEYVRAFITGFYSDFTDQIFSDPVQDENGNVVEAQTLLESETLGLEAEIGIGPFYGFGANINLTLQDPEIEGFEVLGDNDFGVVGDEFVGNEIQRIAGTILRVEPRYDFFYNDFAGAVFLKIYHVDDRFANNGNTVVLPSYTTVGAGFTLDWKNYELTITGDNLTNTIGVTEGNPRTDAFATGQSSIATFARPIVGRNFRVKFGYRF